MKESVTIEEAFAIVIELFKAEQLRREKAEQFIGWIGSHEATGVECRSMAKKYLDSLTKSAKDGE